MDDSTPPNGAPPLNEPPRAPRSWRLSARRVVVVLWFLSMAIAARSSTTVAGSIFTVGVLAVMARNTLPVTRRLWAEGRADTVAWWQAARASVGDAAVAVAPSALVQAGWQVAGWIMLAVLAFVVLFPKSSITPSVFAGGMWVYLAIGTWDLVGFGRAFVRWSVGRRVMVVVLALGTALAAAVALGLARRALFAWTGEDPGAFPVSLGFFTGVFVPVAWLFMASLVGIALVWPVMLPILWQVLPFHASSTDRPFPEFLRGVRPVLLCFVPVVWVATIFSVDLGHASALQQLGRRAVVALDYFDRPVCDGPVALAHRLDDRHYSVLQSAHGEVRFRTFLCPESKVRVVDHD